MSISHCMQHTACDTLLWHLRCNTQESAWLRRTHTTPPHCSKRSRKWQRALTSMPAGSRRCPPQYSSGHLYQNQLPCGQTHRDSIYLCLSVYIPRSPAMCSLLHTSRKWAIAYVTAHACRQHTQIKSIYACFSILQWSTYHIICPQRRCHARRYTCSRHAHTSNASLITGHIEEPAWQGGTRSSPWLILASCIPAQCPLYELEMKERFYVNMTLHTTHCIMEHTAVTFTLQHISLNDWETCVRKYTCLRHAHTSNASLIAARFEQPEWQCSTRSKPWLILASWLPHYE